MSLQPRVMLDAVRDELRDEIRSAVHGLKAEFKRDRYELKADHQSLKADFNKMEVRMERVEQMLAKMSAETHRQLAIAEEQNARNKVVMDGLTSLFGRQERIETKTDNLEKTIAGFRK